MRTYRLVVVGSILSSFLVGLHLPALHDMIEHGRSPRWEVLAATLLLMSGSVAGTWMLLRMPAQIREPIAGSPSSRS